MAWTDALYPDQLRDLPDPPLCLFVRGGADAATTRARISAIVDAPLVAVVGTRTPSPYGEEMARAIAGDLARAGLVVVSGMAMGIDAIAQTAAVDAVVPVSPATVAVLGCGADVVYPRSNARLYATGRRRRAHRQRVRVGRSSAAVAVSGAQPGDGGARQGRRDRGGHRTQRSEDHGRVRRRARPGSPVRARRGGAQAQRGTEPPAPRRGAGL